MLHIAYHPNYVLPVREGHRFPMLKYELIPDQLLHEGIVAPENFFLPTTVSPGTLSLAHDQNYVEDVLNLRLTEKMVRRIGFPLSQELVDRECLLVQGTIDSSQFAVKNGVSFNIAGGTHHAGRNFGEGFCLFNDQAVAAAFLIENKLAKRVLIVDLDVHQGNGTAHIFKEHRNVFTFSMHAERNFPFIKEKSSKDVPLADGVQDDEYLLLLKRHLKNVFDVFRPDFVFFQAGVDVLSTDKLGKLNLSADACRIRDELVFLKCKEFGVPVQVSMGGGYSMHIKDIVNAHVASFRAAIDVFDF
ncbi:histone deacetylase [Sphingobacterium shayense]|uniref:histone deacetylase n=1 Tax=Sphingobacterium shayense TaxID=626343 RepID=UPI0015522862|nr:histone deacetylase [Sphingobacterium shayense]